MPPGAAGEQEEITYSVGTALNYEMPTNAAAPVRQSHNPKDEIQIDTRSQPPSQLLAVEVEENDFYPERTALPFKKDPSDRPSVWKILKDAVGKDLSKFCVPVYFNEPVSMVQKVAEIMEYQELLNQADNESDPVKRILLVSAFGIAQYKCTDSRLNKPFNPILGETFELIHKDYKYFAE